MDKGGLKEKDVLAGEIQETEMSEVLKESPARRRRWVALCGFPLLCSPMLAYEAYGRATCLAREARSQSAHLAHLPLCLLPLLRSWEWLSALNMSYVPTFLSLFHSQPKQSCRTSSV